MIGKVKNQPIDTSKQNLQKKNLIQPSKEDRVLCSMYENCKLASELVPKCLLQAEDGLMVLEQNLTLTEKAHAIEKQNELFVGIIENQKKTNDILDKGLNNCLDTLFSCEKLIEGLKNNFAEEIDEIRDSFSNGQARVEEFKKNLLEKRKISKIENEKKTSKTTEKESEKPKTKRRFNLKKKFKNSK